MRQELSLRTLQHDLLVFSATSSLTGAACIDRKAECDLLSFIQKHLFRYSYKPTKTAKQHVSGKDPETGGSIEQQTLHATSHISTQKHLSRHRTMYLHSNKQIKIVKPSAE